MTRKEKNRIKQIYLKPLDSIWAIFVNMDSNDREVLNRYINEMNDKNCSFVHYNAKDFLNKMIGDSDCYHKK